MSIGPTTRLAINNFGDKPIENMPTIAIPGIGPDSQAKLAQKGIVTALHLYNKLKDLNFNEQQLRVFMEARCKIAKPRVPVIHGVLMKWHKQFGEPQRCDSENTRAGNPPAQSVGRGGAKHAASATKRPRTESDDSGVGVQRARIERPVRAAGRDRGGNGSTPAAAGRDLGGNGSTPAAAGRDRGGNGSTPATAGRDRGGNRSTPAAAGRDLGGNGSTPAAARRSVQFNTHDLEPRSNNSSNMDLSDDDSLNNVRSHSSHPLVQFLASLSTVFEKIPENMHSKFRRDILNLVDKYEPQPSTSR